MTCRNIGLSGMFDAETIELPHLKMVAGVTQKPLTGVSMLYAAADANAKGGKACLPQAITDSKSKRHCGMRQ